MSHPHDPDDLSDASGDALDLFVGAIVGAIVRRASTADLSRLAAQSAPLLLPLLPEHPDAREDVQAMARMLARCVADHTPRPERRFAVLKSPRPGRNDPCDCGSGRKFKQCCLPLESGAPANPIEGMNLLPYVLDNLPRRRWAELVGSAIDPLAVDYAARAMLEGDEADRAIALLEPWFAGTAEISGRLEPLLDSLLDAYSVLARPRKKRTLIERALEHGDRIIRSSMHQRLATMAADEGDYGTAWRHFREAQRENADAASLSHLEVILLLNQGESERARERARFWIARLRRIDPVGHAGLIGLLEELVENGAEALVDMQTGLGEELDALRGLARAAPAPMAAHGFAGGSGEDLGMMVPDRELAAALDAWREVFPQVGPALTSLVIEEHPAWDVADTWLRCLRERPLLWQSFDVLDDLVLALTAVYVPGIEPLRDALLGRAETLLHLTLDPHTGKTLEWGHMANRPALRLLAQYIATDDEQPGDATLARMEWALALNPGDKHDYRTAVAAARLERREPERALEIVVRYPEDTSLCFARVLALYALGREGEALQVLRQAHALLPRIAPMLAAARPRKPALDPRWYTYGGADQAWHHRERFLGAWQTCEGALPWLRKALKALGRAG
ncbi:SEC-C domain-containing protein [Luteimonas sp. SJ-92]|uniref:SEC-C domain-containing protein n=1 Tax=Luteimonas salinisoli TaxID=2752307 RepID=A0A853J808_9GAMM|nr:SEC-C metal-binding domain-containing protein [Luteimonas salinisoli]NZA25296.1 SEC-C domain-containing protein [Luteimonas salinisoli]